MAETTVRTHLVVPRELIEQVDELVGQRGRSRFFAEAAGEKLGRLRLSDVVRRMAGSLAEVDIPGWESGESSEAWVRALRNADAQRADRLAECE